MSEINKLVGIGLGPFNLSLAALADHKNIQTKFLESKSNFSWHSELMHSDSLMQTSYLKDLVTPVDPTARHSFLNYLVSKGLFYNFMNTARQTIDRIEFEDYCKWVSENLRESINYDTKVESLKFNEKEGLFVIDTNREQIKAKNLCLGSGPRNNIPECTQNLQGKKLFHVKSEYMKTLDMTGKKVLVVGGGQSGLEIFRNALKQKWGTANHVKLITGRDNLKSLDEGCFTDEFFSPSYVNNFTTLEQQKRDELVKDQLLTSDGNTPKYLDEFYQELYLDKFYYKKFCDYEIAPLRWLENVEDDGDLFKTKILDMSKQTFSEEKYDLIILATGFKSALPKYCHDLYQKISFDNHERPKLNNDYTLVTDLPSENRIYAMNMSRHFHGIADPQISLMAWRSARILNSLMKSDVYDLSKVRSGLLRF